MSHKEWWAIKMLFLLFILENYYFVSPLVGVFFLALTPIWIIIAAKHPATRTVLHSGWEPVITAMVISRLVLKCMSIPYMCVVVFLGLIILWGHVLLTAVVRNVTAVTEINASRNSLEIPSLRILSNQSLTTLMNEIQLCCVYV